MDHDRRPDPARTVWLVRHARAALRGPLGDDPGRPLVPAGLAQARRLAGALAAWGERPDAVLTSPWLRAAATAEALRGDAPVRVVEALAAPDPAAASAAILAALGPHERTVAVVGHEPWLGWLASWWLCGHEHGVAIEFRKASALALVGVPGPGRMALTGFVPMRWVKALQGG